MVADPDLLTDYGDGFSLAQQNLSFPQPIDDLFRCVPFSDHLFPLFTILYLVSFSGGRSGLDDLSPRIQQLRQRKEQLQAGRLGLEQELSDRRLELADAETVTRCVSELRDLLSESSLAERKSFIRSFVKEIIVTGDEVLLTYTIPMLPRGVTEEKLPVLSIVHDGGRFWIRTRDPSLIRTVL